MANRHIFSGRQWIVSRAKLYTRRPGGSYVIDRERIAETVDYGRGPILNWPMHMGGKEWVDFPDFEVAFRRAIQAWAPETPAALIEESFNQSRQRHGARLLTPPTPRDPRDVAVKLLDAADLEKTNARFLDRIAKYGPHVDDERWRLTQECKHAFADLNGWRLAQTQFTPDALARRMPHGGRWYDVLPGPLDHAEYYREATKPYRAIAIVAHNYAPPDRDGSREFCHQFGLIARRPDALLASWYYPGSTHIVCYTRPDVDVVWFCEQSALKWAPRS